MLCIMTPTVLFIVSLQKLSAAYLYLHWSVELLLAAFEGYDKQQTTTTGTSFIFTYKVFCDCVVCVGCNYELWLCNIASFWRYLWEWIFLGVQVYLVGWLPSLVKYDEGKVPILWGQFCISLRNLVVQLQMMGSTYYIMLIGVTAALMFIVETSVPYLLLGALGDTLIPKVFVYGLMNLAMQIYNPQSNSPNLFAYKLRSTCIIQYVFLLEV